MTNNKATTGNRAGTTLDPSRGPAVFDMPRLTSFGDVDAVFRSRDFEQGGGGRRDSAPITGDGLLSLSGGDHLERRRIESALFRRPLTRFYEEDVLAPALAAELADYAVRPTPEATAAAEMLGLIQRALLSVACSLGGLDGVVTPERRARLLLYLDRMAAGANVEWAACNHAEVVADALEHMRLFGIEFVAPSWERREGMVAAWKEGQLEEGNLPHDMITLMVRNAEHFERWDWDVRLREMALFLSALTDTVVQSVAHTVAELAGWFGALHDRSACLKDPDFLRLATLEALRLHPPSPFFIRRAIKDTSLPSGRYLRAGDYVVLDIIQASRDASMYGEDALLFNPLRRNVDRLRPSGMVFGDGPHTCIGMALSIGDAGKREDATAPLGLVIYLLRELYRAGVELDPLSPAAWVDSTVRDVYASFPVVFTTLAHLEGAR